MRRKAAYTISMLISAMMAMAKPLAADLTVVYPQVKAPYNEIFEQIIRGIEHQQQDGLQLYPLDGKSPLENTAKELSRDPTKLVIALGKSGYQVAQKIQQTNSVVVSALPLQPAGIAGISLLTDPKVLFTSLKMLAPAIKKVHVVYSDSSRWLIQIAVAQAADFGIEVIAAEVKDLRDAVTTYQDLLQNIDPASNAVWLPFDAITANEQVILPQVLELAWERNIVLFSSKPEHAKRGALFSTFPDHFELGRELVILVQQLQQGKAAATVIPLQQVQLAVNLRTAAHIGMEYKQEVLRQIPITFR
ncbi:MAG: ABC transporter substrate binding protein [Rheinheimera sp.]|nr:ABC transporter substrate binding protein [Rheinheimera sp.]